MNKEQRILNIVRELKELFGGLKWTIECDEEKIESEYCNLSLLNNVRVNGDKIKKD